MLLHLRVGGFAMKTMCKYLVRFATSGPPPRPHRRVKNCQTFQELQWKG